MDFDHIVARYPGERYEPHVFFLFFFLSFGPLKISAYSTSQKDSWKSILARDLKLSQLIEE